MSIAWLLLLATLNVSAPNGETSALEERLRYHAGSFMSGSVDLDLDLATGEFVLKEESYNGKETVPSSTSGRLSSAALAEVRELASLGLSKGLETEACKQERAKGSLRPPMFDFSINMTVQMRERWEAAPTFGDCWTKAANDLEHALLSATKTASL